MQHHQFSIWFKSTTGNLPFPYQQDLAESEDLPDILNVMTGAGKTLAIITTWLWRSFYHVNLEVRKTTPHKLVIVLPMRTLVEQTFAVAEKCLEQAGLAEIKIQMLMGGAIDSDWELHLEHRAILIGTQDQLLSRGLNRGYAMSPFKWPIHYGLLNNDCLWVFDEVQLMGVGLKTSTQLQGFREKFGTYGTTKSLWMSATIKPEQLQTIDFKSRELRILNLSEKDRSHPVLQQRIQAKKALHKAQTIFDGKEPEYAKKLAKEVYAAHQAGKLTLVVVNKVSRARAVYEELKKLVGNECPIRLIHSRFRSEERKKLTKILLDPRSLTGFLITTQAVEAGVDISAAVVFTELTTWWSFVQRVGRCNRYGENDLAKVFWIDIDLTKKNVSRPYDEEDLKQCQQELLKVELIDVGSSFLEAVEVPPPDVPGNLLRRTDLLQLFDTSEDLAGHTIDISSFIRDTSETDVGIAWREWEGEKPPEEKIEQIEICRANRFSKESIAFLKDKKSLWVRNNDTGEWENPKNLYSGMTILVHCDRGGYDPLLGFTGDPKNRPLPVLLKLNELEDSDRADRWTQIGEYITIAQHAEDVAQEVTRICQQLTGWELPTQELIDSGRWHDQGKAHEAFQEMLTQNRPDRKNGELWAKSDNGKGKMEVGRQGFRHELVSALCALETGQSFLLAYLVAAHHGKVRMQIQPRPHERLPKDENLRYALGVRDGDPIPAVDLGAGINSPEITIDLSCMELGGGQSGKPSWAQQAADLLAEYGPFKLALLESIIRIADIRVSQEYQKQQGQKND